MSRYEYKVVPAPVKGTKAKGAKTSEARFALTLTNLMNEMGSDGWEYLRADSLPAEERTGLTGRTTKFQNLLVFRRELEGAPAQPEDASDDEAPSEPEAIARAAGATLRAVPDEGNAPAVNRGDEGKPPRLGNPFNSDEREWPPKRP